MDYATIHIFGCPAYNLVDSQKRNKLESKSKKCIFIGYTAGGQRIHVMGSEDQEHLYEQ